MTSSIFSPARSFGGGAAILAAMSVLFAAACGANAQGLGVELVGGDTAKVSSADLDMSTRDGPAQLLHRIQMASRDVCADQGYDPVFAMDYFGCVRRTTADAVARIDDPRITALYRGSGGDRAILVASSH